MGNPETKSATLVERAQQLGVEPWKVAAVMAKFKLYPNSEVSDEALKGYVADVEGIAIGGAQPAPAIAPPAPVAEPAPAAAPEAPKKASKSST